MIALGTDAAQSIQGALGGRVERVARHGQPVPGARLGESSRRFAGRAHAGRQLRIALGGGRRGVGEERGQRIVPPRRLQVWLRRRLIARESQRRPKAIAHSPVIRVRLRCDPEPANRGREITALEGELAAHPGQGRVIGRPAVEQP